MAVGAALLWGAGRVANLTDTAGRFTYELIAGNTLRRRSGTLSGNLTFRLINRGTANVKVQRINLDIIASGFELGRVDVNPNLSVPRGEERVLEVPVSVALLQFLINLLSRIFGGRLTASARIVGRIWANGVPIEVNEPYNIQKDDG